jgi:hypothetical protein
VPRPEAALHQAPARAQHDIEACPQAEPTPARACMQTLEQADLVAHALAGFLPAEGQASAAW